jgi:hypothetical protein
MIGCGVNRNPYLTKAISPGRSLNRVPELDSALRQAAVHEQFRAGYESGI